MMIRDQNLRRPSGPRPADFPSRQNENLGPVNINSARSRITSGSREPNDNHSHFSFGDSQAGEAYQSSSNSCDFLPSVNFDDLQSSIATASSDLRASQRSPVLSNGFENMARIKPAEEVVTRPVGESRPPLARPPANARTSRSGSVLRRQTSTRQSSLSSNTSGTSAGTDSFTAPVARTRKPSQYPPVSGTGASKAPRRSIGYGGAGGGGGSGGGESDSSASGTSSRTRGLVNNGSLHNVGSVGQSARSSTTANAVAAMEGARLASARASKATSLQPPSKTGSLYLSAPITAPEHTRSSSFAGRSPVKTTSGRGPTTPSSASRRMSTLPGMPPSSSHATGLGARTVSPTDARRAKRMSVMQGPPPLPCTPPTSTLPRDRSSTMVRNSSKSPSMLPRKSQTPTSSRTTPDPNRKSYSSGQSSASTTSFNTARTSTGSLQPRLPQPANSSRLPTLKPNTRSVHSSAGNNEDEEVPPVPAIPKAYESPKDSPAEPPFFTSRKSSLPMDSLSTNSDSTADWPAPSVEHALKQRELSSNTGWNTTTETESRHQLQTPTKRKNLQPLRLPPLNLLPLSTPVSAKVAALKPDSTPLSGAVTPPPRHPTKTPSTPMTASKTAFFSSRPQPEPNSESRYHAMRSSSSGNQLSNAPPPATIRHVSGAGQTMVVPTTSQSLKQTSCPPRQQSISPFVSSSLPKSSSEYSLPRSTPSSDATGVPSSEPNYGDLQSSRAPAASRRIMQQTPNKSSPDEGPAPASSTSLRRKLSMGWKRSTSKSSISLSHLELPPQVPKHNDMPPPRLPASATMNSISSYNSVPSPSPAVKPVTYIDASRRQSSISSLNVFGSHGRTPSDDQRSNGSPKKDTATVVVERTRLAQRTSSAVLSTAQKMLHGKSSTSTMRSTASDSYTLDLDRDDMAAEEEMRKLASRRRETETAAKHLDALRKRAVPRERASPQDALKSGSLNIYERGEIIDYKDIFFTGTANAQKHIGDLKTDTANFGYDDDRGDYSIIVGDHLSYRYEIVDILGKGSFGQVVRCVDHKTGGLVAIKIIRNKKRFHQQALVEVNILKKLREWDPNNKHSMVSFTQSFYFRGHLCISTELLDMNLYEFIKSNHFKGFSLKLIRRFTKQLLSSLILLKQRKVIHCDLKPENILLAHPMHSEIKVIDFGSSCFENEKVYTYIQSRFYRSPEVILGMSYGLPIDMWSVGCILAELYTGYPIFPGENEQEQLACIMEVFGPPEKHLIEKSTRKKLFFDSQGKPRLTVSSKGRRRKPSSKTLTQVLKCDDEAFLDFLARCMRWDPDRRLKPEDAVRHEFLTGSKHSGVPRATAPRASSPLKRFNTIAAPPSSSSASRPLPEPPATSFKNGIAIRHASGGSPVKALPRRQSTATNNMNSSTSSGHSTHSLSKRTSLGGTAIAGASTTSSALPRIAQRAVSGNMAGAGATAAFKRTQ